MYKTSIKLDNNSVTKIDTYLLDALALKRYKKPYAEVMKQVNKDVRNLSNIYNTYTVKDIRFLLILELLSPKDKHELSILYGNHLSLKG